MFEADIVTVLTDRPSRYIKDMGRRDEGFKERWGRLPPSLKYLPKEEIRESNQEVKPYLKDGYK